jgi:chemotaxis protein CheX
MDVRYINPFITAVQSFFDSMLGELVVISKPALKTSSDPHIDVSALIEFSGDAAGCVMLCFPKRAAAKIASKLAGRSVSTLELTALSDALGEMANMVAGQAKAKLPQTGVSISLPRVVLCADDIESISEQSPVIVLRCDSGLGRFSVEVMMHPYTEPIESDESREFDNNTDIKEMLISS